MLRTGWNKRSALNGRPHYSARPLLAHGRLPNEIERERTTIAFQLTRRRSQRNLLGVNSLHFFQCLFQLFFVAGDIYNLPHLRFVDMQMFLHYRTKQNRKTQMIRKKTGTTEWHLEYIVACRLHPAFLFLYSHRFFDHLMYLLETRAGAIRPYMQVPESKKKKVLYFAF